MNKHDVGVLKRGDSVITNGRPAIVVSPHEPEWIDHKTRQFRKEFQGADLRLDDGRCAYIHAANIEPVSKGAAP